MYSVACLGIPLHYQPIDTAPRRRLPPHLVRLAPGTPFRPQVLRHRHRAMARLMDAEKVGVGRLSAQAERALTARLKRPHLPRMNRRKNR